MKFSDDQQKVIDTEGKNILVSAAAGSGKTAVLVERIIRKICGNERINVDSLLVMTFTKAAAAEMRERIEKAVNSRLYKEIKRGEDKELIAHLKKQSMYMSKASITTIDSFCGEIIKNNFAQIGLDPVYRIAEEAELSLLKADCVNAVLEDEYEKMDEAFLDFMECFSTKKSDDDVIAAIFKLYEFSCSKINPAKWILNLAKNYDVSSEKELFELPLVTDYIDSLRDEIRGYALASRKDVRTCERPAGPYAYAEILEKEAEDFERIAKITDVTELKSAIDGYEFARMPRITAADAVDANLKEMVQKSRDVRKKSFKALIASSMGADKEVLLSDCMACYKVASVLSDLTLKFYNAFSLLKAEKQLLDFSDLEHFALQILYEEDEVTPSVAALEYKKKFSEIMVDEYQDSNEVQEALITAICKDNNVFTVGDVKQSIYKFRLSDPRLFMKRMNSFPKIDTVSDQDLSVRIDLKSNFRSSEQVLNATNYVFDKIMHPQVGDVEYDEDARLSHGRLQAETTDNSTELILINEAEEIDNKETEAIVVAQKIKSLMDSFEFPDKDSGELRKLKFSDIAILLRSRTGWEDVFSKVLNDYDIPNHTESSTGYFTSYEIKNILSFLAAINNPANDEILCAALAGPFGGFSDEELSNIRLGCKEGSFYEAFRKSNSDKVKEFYQKIKHYRELSAYTKVNELVIQIINDYDYELIVLAMENGQVRKANLNSFIKRAVDYEKTSFKGLHDFLRYIERIRSYEIDFGESELIGENDNCVKIMSIHKSKGLEFPIAIVAGTAKEYNLTDVRASLIMDADEGIGMDFIDPKKRIKAPTIIKKAIAYKQKKDLFGEELRILYVAMTRAREKLIMTGVINYDKLDSFADMGSEYSATAILSASSYLKLLLMCVYGKEDAPFEIKLVEAKDILENEIAIEEAAEKFSADAVLKLLEEKAKVKIDNELDGSVEIDETQGNDDLVYINQMKERFAYRYPHKTDVSVPMKLSVSAIKKLAIEEDFSMHAFDADGEMEKAENINFDAEMEKSVATNAKVPYFISGEKKQDLIGALRGTAYHRYFELLDFGDEIKLLSDSYVNKGMITKEQYDAVNPADIDKFFDTKLCKRMCEAAIRGELYKEQPFSYMLNANEVDEKYPADESIVIQGIIDAFFIEDGKIIIMDYKTDKVFKGERLVELYHKQLELYAGALTQITGKEVAECIIYSVTLGEEIELC